MPQGAIGRLATKAALALSLLACSGPVRPERFVLDASAIGARTWYRSGTSAMHDTWTGHVERRHDIVGLDVVGRYESGRGGGVALRFGGVYDQSGRSIHYSPDGVESDGAGATHQRFVAGLLLRGRGERFTTDIGLNALIPTRGPLDWLPWLTVRGTADTVDSVICLGPEDPQLLINLIGYGLGVASGALDVRVIASIHGRMHTDPFSDEDPLSYELLGLGGWIDARYDAGPVGILFSAVAHPQPAARIGLIWAWTIDPSPPPIPWGDVDDPGPPAR